MIHYASLPTSNDGLLGPTRFLDCDSPVVRDFASRAAADAHDERSRAVALYYAVRDRIRYDPYRIGFEPEAYAASRIIADGFGWCVSKAVVLAACARAVGIASAIGLADVVNHLNTEKLRARLGGVDVFYDHGYAALLVNGRWVKGSSRISSATTVTRRSWRRRPSRAASRTTPGAERARASGRPAQGNGSDSSAGVIADRIWSTIEPLSHACAPIPTRRSQKATIARISTEDDRFIAASNGWCLSECWNSDVAMQQ